MTAELVYWLKLLWPLVAIDFGLRLYCCILIFRDGVRNLNKWIWAAILFINLGWAFFLIFGRRRD